MCRNMPQKKKEKINRILKIVFEYFMVALGCLIMALGFNMFCVPTKIAPGGFSGLAAVVYYLTGFPAGAATFILSIPWFFVLLKSRGGNEFVKSLFGTGAFSLFIDLTAHFPAVADDLFLAAVFGGIVMGLGLGIVYVFKGTTGGTDLLAALLHHKFTTVSAGAWLLAVDCIVVVIAGVVLKNIRIALYSAVTIYVSMKVIDVIQNGMDYTKAFYIFTDKHTQIQNEIFEKLNRGVTLLKAVGGYTGEERNVLLCVVNRMQISDMKTIIKKHDPNAFVFLADVNEVLGEGFEK